MSAKSKLYLRLALLGLITLALTVVLTAALFQLQLVETAPEIVKKNDRRYITDLSVPAARGSILDRYGRELVTNSTAYNIKLNYRQISLAEANANGSSSDILLSLIALCRSEDAVYTDTFPVTYAPYRYQTEPTSTQTKRLERFLNSVEKPDITADELMVYLRERYMIPEDYSDDDARLVAGIRYEMELRELFYDIPPYVFAYDISVRLMTLIEERRFNGVVIESVASREYKTQYAAHILGRIGPIYDEAEYEALKDQGYEMDAVVGKDGIEKAAESWLRSIDGVKRVETTIAGQVTNETYVKEPQAGMHVYTTIDLRLQELVERALKRGIESLQATGVDNEGGQAQVGAAVVIDVNSGEILAMASYPSFDLSSFNQNYQAMNEDPLKPMYNRAIAGTYAPGSVFKMCTGIAALQSGVITLKSSIYDKGIYQRYAPSYTPKCTGTHGNVNIYGALKVSCNYFFYEVGRLVGIEQMNAYAVRFGLGQESGIEIDGERYGVLAGPEYTDTQNLRWNPGDVIQSAIGQSYNSFTPLQLAVYTATIANGGLRYRPHLLKSVRSYDYSREAYEIQPEILEDLNLSPANIAAIQQGMRQVAQNGGTAARTFANYPIEVAAKTGTAQSSTNRPDNGVFVAYAPYDNPEIAVAVVVEKGAGGSRVAPIAREIFTAYFDIEDKMDAY